MIIINKSGHLKYKDLKFKCALGKAGIGKKKIEGDKITPRGKLITYLISITHLIVISGWMTKRKSLYVTTSENPSQSSSHIAMPYLRQP